MLVIYWVGPVQYKPLVGCIDLNCLKHEYGGWGLWNTHDCILSNKITKPGSEAQTLAFRRKPHLETQATERLFKDAPPSILISKDQHLNKILKLFGLYFILIM